MRSKPPRLPRALRAVLPTAMTVAALATAPALAAARAPAAPRVRASEASATIDPDLLAGLQARNVGPAGTSGRVTAVDAVVADPNVLWIGAAGGGVWRSRDGGLTWEPRFDEQPVHSIGALAIDQKTPDVVWVGTGEANLRNSVSVGNGIYRTRDGGETWQHLGLEGTEHVARLLLVADRPEVAYVCATGTPWNESAERGVFKTSDGGSSWHKVLYVDARTGCGDLAMDPTNPDHLIAGMWQFRRWPWFMASGGPGSGLHVTWDGGTTWKRLQPDDGLPAGDLGRAAIAFAPSSPHVVYALVEADNSALLRSTDGGRRWETVNDETNVAPRPFYFAQIRVDPRTPDVVYSADYGIRVSKDAGQTFRQLSGTSLGQIHGDYHALWIDPRDPRLMVVASDGGVAISRNGGDTFRFVTNLPLAQPYHVAVDDDLPFHLYGGLQDNGSWRGPSEVWREGGIRSDEWQMIGDGDGFDARPDPTDSLRGYSLWQGGNLVRWDLRTGEQKGIQPLAPAGQRLRYNWNAGFAIDPFDPATIYLGSQYLHRSRDRGETWEQASPDLTTNDPEWQRQDDSGGLTPDVTAAEAFTTIVAIAPSPVERGVIWVGSDDGRVQVTRDGAKTWTSVEGALRGVAAHAWVAKLVASRHGGGVAYAVLDDHRRGDVTPYVFATHDYGRNWQRLGVAGVRGYALTIAEDAVDPGLLFLGTEFGLWMSRDGGQRWAHLAKTIPTAAVVDLAVQPRSGDLAIATHGRSFWVLDDISALRTLTAATLNEPLRLFPPRPAQQHWVADSEGGFGLGAGEFRGDNAPYGALLTFSLGLPGLPLQDLDKERDRKEQERRRELAGEARLGSEGRAEAMGRAEPAGPSTPPAASEQAAAAGAKARPEEATREKEREREKATKKEPEVEIAIADAAGHPVRTLHAPAKRGLQRVVWDLHRDAGRELPKVDEDAAAEKDALPTGPEVPPGDYTVTLRIQGHSVSAPLRVLPDPRCHNTPEQWQSREAAIRRGAQLQDALAETIWRLRRTKDDVNLVEAKERDRRRDAGERDEAKLDEDPLVVAGEALLDQLDDLERKLWKPPEGKGIPAETDLLSLIAYAASYPESSWDPPSPTQLAWLGRAEERLGAVRAEVEALYAKDVAAFRSAATAAGVGLFAGTPAAH